MCDQDALGPALTDLDMGLDGVAAAAHVGGDIGRHMAHPRMEDEIASRTLKACGILRKARAETIVERQHIVFFRLAPPQFYHLGEALRLAGREIVNFGEIAIEMKQLPFVVLERGARRMIGDRLPALVPKAAMAEHFEILRR